MKPSKCPSPEWRANPLSIGCRWSSWSRFCCSRSSGMRMKLPIRSAQPSARPQAFIVSKMRCGLSSPSLSAMSTMRSLQSPAHSAETSGPSAATSFRNRSNTSRISRDGAGGKGLRWTSASRVSASPGSRWSTVRPYLRLTVTTRPANQQRFMGGSHSAASRAHFPEAPQRFTAGAARVRLSRSEAKRRRVVRSAAQRPLSWASETATMCSMSVCPVLAKYRPV